MNISNNSSMENINSTFSNTTSQMEDLSGKDELMYIDGQSSSESSLYTPTLSIYFSFVRAHPYICLISNLVGFLALLSFYLSKRNIIRCSFGIRITCLIWLFCGVQYYLMRYKGAHAFWDELVFGLLVIGSLIQTGFLYFKLSDYIQQDYSPVTFIVHRIMSKFKRNVVLFTLVLLLTISSFTMISIWRGWSPRPYGLPLRESFEINVEEEIEALTKEVITQISAEANEDGIKLFLESVVWEGLSLPLPEMNILFTSLFIRLFDRESEKSVDVFQFNTLLLLPIGMLAFHIAYDIYLANLSFYSLPVAICVLLAILIYWIESGNKITEQRLNVANDDNEIDKRKGFVHTKTKRRKRLFEFLRDCSGGIQGFITANIQLYEDIYGIIANEFYLIKRSGRIIPIKEGLRQLQIESHMSELICNQLFSFYIRYTQHLYVVNTIGYLFLGLLIYILYIIFFISAESVSFLINPSAKNCIN